VALADEPEFVGPPNPSADDLALAAEAEAAAQIEELEEEQDIKDIERALLGEFAEQGESILEEATEQDTDVLAYAEEQEEASAISWTPSFPPKIPTRAVTVAGTSLNRFYFLRTGDTPQTVAKLLYGDQSRENDLWTWNSKKKWKPGQFVLYASPAQPEDQVVRSFYDVRQMQYENYQILRGDSLSKIARARFGDLGSWKEIAVQNNIDKPDVIHPGQTLKLSAVDLSPYGYQTAQTVAALQQKQGWEGNSQQSAVDIRSELMLPEPDFAANTEGQQQADWQEQTDQWQPEVSKANQQANAASAGQKPMLWKPEVDQEKPTLWDPQAKQQQPTLSQKHSTRQPQQNKVAAEKPVEAASSGVLGFIQSHLITFFLLITLFVLGISYLNYRRSI